MIATGATALTTATVAPTRRPRRITASVSATASYTDATTVRATRTVTTTVRTAIRTSHSRSQVLPVAPTAGQRGEKKLRAELLALRRKDYVHTGVDHPRSGCRLHRQQDRKQVGRRH